MLLFGVRAVVERRLPIDGSEVAGTGCRHGIDADQENGPAARSFAADAHDCIMVRIQTDRPHTSSRREERCAAMASSPRIITQTYNRRHQTREVRRKAHLLSIVPPRARGSRRCETQASLRRQAAKAPLAFRSLDPFRALREPDCRRRDEKRPFPLRTKNFSITQNNRLTGKAPYKSANSQSLPVPRWWRT